MTESDTDLVVEYEEQPGGATSHTEGEDSTASDSNTVNQDQDQDQDSFSILEGDSLLDGEGSQPDMPPLFVHVTCSINMKSCHGSTPIQTLPTCLSKSLCPMLTFSTIAQYCPTANVPHRYQPISADTHICSVVE